MNPKADFFFDKAESWKAEYRKLREIALGSGLAEEVKWGCPCYALEGRNVVLIHGFKEYCALLFFKGALMDDPDGLLVQQTENVQSARQIRFGGLGEIEELEPVLKAYIERAIAVEKAGLKVEYKQTREFAAPEELRERFDEDPGFRKAFEKLTPGRQRAYLLHFSAPKQSKTRVSRIEKCEENIRNGLGLNDK